MYFSVAKTEPTKNQLINQPTNRENDNFNLPDRDFIEILF